MITIPLWARGAVAAVLALFSSSQRMFRSDDARLAREFGYRAAGALENALLYRELRQAIKTREDVLAIVSHDLRNPLMVIMSAVRRLGSTDLAKREDLQRFMNALAVSADQMRRLIDDLLDFSRMESGTFSIRKTAAYASDLIAETVEGMRSQAETRRQTIVADVPAALPEIECDARRMGQALSNLLGNAIKFTPEGGVVQVSARVQRRELVVTVRDFGPGIPFEHLSHIFDRYWQAEETKMMGAGLGLFIAKGIVEAHNGRIWAESEMGEGSSFHFAVPLERVDNTLSRHSQPSGTG
jgi:signal transduction histidine kinase